MPDQIGGQDVIGTADDFVIGGDLILHSDSYPIYEFDKFSADEFEKICSPYGEWCESDTKQKIRQATPQIWRLISLSDPSFFGPLNVSRQVAENE